MKIICTKEEYARMVAQCTLNFKKHDQEPSGCNNCILFDMCNKWDTLHGDVETYEWFLFLNDITEIVDNPTLE